MKMSRSYKVSKKKKKKGGEEGIRGDNAEK